MEIVGTYNNAWKGRGSLEKLVDELKRQRETAVDFVSDTSHFRVTYVAQDGDALFDTRAGTERQAQNGGHLQGTYLSPITPQGSEFLTESVMFNDHAFGQLVDKTTPPIPRKFGKVLAMNRAHRFTDLVNGLHKDQPKVRLVRCLDGRVRAWLSDQYQIVDNFDLMWKVLDTAREAGAEPIDFSLSDTHMRIKLVGRDIYETITLAQQTRSDAGVAGLGNQEFLSKVAAHSIGNMPGGPTAIHPVATISGSEVGAGETSVSYGLLVGVCFNVASVEKIFGRVHLGSKMPEGMFKQDTIAADAEATYLKIRDAVSTCFDREKLKRTIGMVESAQSTPVIKPVDATEQVMKAYDMTDNKKDKILEYFLRDYDPSQFGLSQAVSRLAQDEESGDDAHDLEIVSGKLLTMKSGAFTSLVEA